MLSNLLLPSARPLFCWLFASFAIPKLDRTVLSETTNEVVRASHKYLNCPKEGQKLNYSRGMMRAFTQ
jgi:hypothetical protein